MGVHCTGSAALLNKWLECPYNSRMPLILLNKPYRILSQFRDDDGRQGLSAFVMNREVYPAGRLDYDSEGLLLLTDDGRLQARISQPKSKIAKTYWAQVEGEPTASQLAKLEIGIKLKDGPARALQATQIDEPDELWPREPPIRIRKSVPDSWIEITLTEGRNRQVRRMTAAVGLPTLRLIRAAVGPWSVDGLLPGSSRELGNADAWTALSPSHR